MRYLLKSFVLALIISCSILISIGAKSERENKTSIRAAKITEINEFSNRRRESAIVKDTTITVAYGSVACTCAQWIIYPIYPTQNREYIYLQRTNKRLINADDIWDATHVPLHLKLTGSFDKNKGIPPSYQGAKGNPDPARIFKYTRIEILSVYFKNKKHWGIIPK
jgi:hypothetical protein